jgi:hypothetical protein
MGQYHGLFNIDKREMLFPHEVGFGAKQWEHTGFAGSLSDILYALCAYPERRGGGDFENDNEENTGMFSGIKNGVFKGRWHGDRVAVVGDYAEFGDLPDVWDAAFVEITDYNGNRAKVFNSARTAGDIGWANAEPFFHNIADEVRPFIAKLWERAEADLEALRNKRPVSLA